MAKQIHVLQWVKMEEHEFMQDFPRYTSLEVCTAVKAVVAGLGCVSMMRYFGAMLQQGVEVKAKGSGDGVDSSGLEIKWDATASRTIPMPRGAAPYHIASPTLWLKRVS